MIARDKSITAWQAGIMIFILMFANKVLLLPSLLFEGAKFESIFIPIGLSILEMLLVYLFYRLKNKFPTESFSHVLRKYFGKIPMIIVCLLFALYFLSKAVLLYNITYIFFKTVIYKDSDNFLFLVCFLPIIIHMACSGLRNMGRTIQLFFPMIILLIVFCIVVGIFGINSKPLLFQSSASDVFVSALRHVAAFGDVLFLFVFMHKIKIKKGQWKILFSFSGLSLFLVCVINIVFMLSYTYTAFMHPFALFEIMNYVKEFGAMGRIDILSMVAIVIMSYFHLAIYLKGFMQSFNNIFYKINKLYSIISFVLLFLVLVNYIVLNLEAAVYFGETVLPYASIVPFIIVPIVSLICEFVNWRKKA